MRRGLWLGLATIFTVLTVQIFVVVRRLYWVPKASYDNIGFGWLITNLVPLLAVGGVLACAAFACYCWFRVLDEFL
jgi:hypothetical protein